MGYLLHLLLAMATLAAAESLDAHGLPLPLLALVLVPLPYLLGRLGQARAVRGDWRGAARADRALRWSPPALQLVATTIFGWHAAALEFVGERTALLAWPHPVLFVSLLPFAVYELAAIDARARVMDPRPEGAARLRRLQVRLFVSSVAPLFLFVLLAWALGLSRVVRVHVELVALLNAALAGALVLVMVTFLPRVLRSTWDTVPMAAGPQRSALDDVARHARFRCRELLEWRTGGLLANAAVLGVTPGTRVVMFSDALLSQLDLRQIASVFAHEIGHARRRHIPIFGAFSLAFFLLTDAALAWVQATDEVVALAAVLSALVVWALVFGWLSRRFELDADLFAVELLRDPDALVGALEHVAGAHARRRSSWRHFSTSDRVLFLRANARDPGVGLRLRRQLGRWTRGGLVLFALALLAEGWALGRSYPEDRVRVDLALGRYEEAVGRLAAGPEVSGWTAELVARASTLSTGEVPRARLELHAVLALEEGDPAAALEWLALANLREGESLEQPMRAIEALLADDLDSARRHAERSPAPWPDRLAGVLPGGSPGVLRGDS